MGSDQDIFLFLVTEAEPDRGQHCHSEYRFYIDGKTGSPRMQIWSFSDITMRPGAVSGGIKRSISYNELLEWAKHRSQETFDKYAGINEANWIDYIIDMI